MLRIITSNRQEKLLVELSATLGVAGGGNPLQPDALVAERGTDQWLWQFLAQSHGIAANLTVEPPAAFIWRALRCYITNAPADAHFNRAPLTWRLLRLLPGLLAQPDFAPLRTYLLDDDGRKSHALCDRIAAVFNDYLVYRPELILAWDAGKLRTEFADERWQQQLWQAVTAETGTLHRARLLQEYFRHDSFSRNTPDRPAGLPARVSIFGIPALPPVYVQALAQLGKHMDIDLYVLNPCGEFWGDIESPGKITVQADGTLDDSNIGNRLLASWGQPVCHFISELFSHEAGFVDQDQPQENPRTLLQHLQDDIHRLQETSRTLAADDDSLRIVNAYGPMREVEILHDTLLDHFQRKPGLVPRDILVMVPEIERYAPCIEAVFGAAEGARFIPWSITDISRRQSHPLTAAVEQLLRLPESRFAASEVLGLLETPAVARRFALDGEALGKLRAALLGANLHGDLDAAARVARGLPADATHTWQFALQRLFLGVAMSEQETPVLGVLPAPALEGKGAEILGHLQTFIDQLARWQQRLALPQTPAQWLALLHALVDDFFTADDDEQDVLDDILKSAREFFDETRDGGFTGELSALVFRDDFLGRLAKPPARGNLRGSGVTFCGMLPMRSMPYKVIALLGMNSEAFPRQQKSPGFDLITLAPKAGDRSRRNDDRHLFLEILLSAREALHISYSGRSLTDNSEKEPSVLVRELLDQVVATHGGEEAREHIENQLIVAHPLQPFSAHYFSGEFSGDRRLFTFDPDWLAPARSVLGSTPAAAFCATPLPAPEASGTDISLDRLARFFAQPQQGFLRERFGIFTREEDDTFADREPFSLDGLAAYALKSEALQNLLDCRTPEQQLQTLRARGDLPQAAFGELAWRKLAADVDAFAQELAPWLHERRSVDIDITLETANGMRRLHGRVNDVTAEGRVEFTVASFKAKYLLALWIRHLALLAAAPAGVEPRSILVTGDKKSVAAVHTLAAVADPRAELAKLVELFEAGLCAPLALLPACSQRYAENSRAPDTEPYKGVAAIWAGNPFNNFPGERDDAAVRICFGDREPPFDAHFEALAHRVFDPLLAVLGSGGEPA